MAVDRAPLNSATAAAVLFLTASLLSAQSAGTFRISAVVGSPVDEPLPCPTGSACDSFASVYVSRVGGATGLASVQLTVTGGTATLGVDYGLANHDFGKPGTVTLTFPDGFSGPIGVAVTPGQDYLPEPDETVDLALANPTGGATIGTPNSATVIIHDTSLQVQSVPGIGPTGLILLGLGVVAAGWWILEVRR
jgi:hypothetical protein